MDQNEPVQGKIAKDRKIQWLRKELRKAEYQVERGEYVPAEKTLAELRQRAD